MLNDTQKATLKADIEATPELVALWAQGNAGAIADYYNAPTNPAFIVWRTSVTQDEIMQNGFDWTRVDNLATGPARIWDWMFNNESRSINPSKLNVRAGIEAVWKGTQADLNVRAAVYGHCKRTATRIEKMFATGTGTDAVPATLVVQGELPFIDIVTAMRA